MPTVTLPHAVLEYDLAGSGDPTAMVHGSLVDRHSWDAVRPRLSETLALLAYDRRGHGESTGDRRGNPVRDDAADLAGLLESLDFFPVHLVAHSYGGAVALRLAHDRPELVRSIAVHEPPFIGLLEGDLVDAPEGARLRAGTEAVQALVRAGRTEEAARQVVDAFSVEEGAWDRLRPEVRSGLLRHIDRWAEELSDPDATRPDPAMLAELLIPVLVTTGERSPPFVRRIAAHLGSALRNATLTTIPDAGHVPHLSDPDRYIALLHGFLVERQVPST